MENKFIDQVSRTFSVELPKRETLDDYLDMVLPVVRPWGEDLRETKFYSASGGKPWLEIKDDEHFQEAVLHFFNDNGEYLQSVEGNISKGRWRLLDGTNKMILEQGGGNRTELYELAFLTNAFFILKKHGYQTGRRGKGKYFVMGFEPYVKGIQWRDYVELIFNTYRTQQGSYQNLIIILIVIAVIVILFSVF